MKASSLKQFAHCSVLRLIIALIFVAAAIDRSAQAESIDASINEHVIMLPVISNEKKLSFETTIFRPPGEGPFPLLIMNHGKDRGDPAKQARDRFLAMSREFVGVATQSQCPCVKALQLREAPTLISAAI